jgi:hypothetical protein
MQILKIFPTEASVIFYAFICIIILLIFRYLIVNIKYLFVDIKKTENGELTPFIILMMAMELLMLVGLLANLAVYYSFQKSTFIKILYHYISVIPIGAELSKNDRQFKQKSTLSIVLLFIFLYIVLIFWDWFRQSIMFSFLFDLLK